MHAAYMHAQYQLMAQRINNAGQLFREHMHQAFWCQGIQHAPGCAASVQALLLLPFSHHPTSQSAFLLPGFIPTPCILCLFAAS
jgi:hypothetical protein